LDFLKVIFIREFKIFNKKILFLQQICQKEGGRAFFNGFFVNAIRSFGAALVLAIYNELNKHLS